MTSNETNSLSQTTKGHAFPSLQLGFTHFFFNGTEGRLTVDVVDVSGVKMAETGPPGMVVGPISTGLAMMGAVSA